MSQEPKGVEENRRNIMAELYAERMEMATRREWSMTGNIRVEAYKEGWDRGRADMRVTACLDTELSALRRENEEFRAALEFYADAPNHDKRREEPNFRREFGCGCCAGTNDEKGDLDFNGDVMGLTAREVLQKWPKEKENK